MTPAGRAAAAIELLTEIAAGQAPADAVLADYFRRRRYAGSGDRRAIRDRVYAVLRSLGTLKACLARAGLDADKPRGWVLANWALATPNELAGAFSGERFGPPPLSGAEARLAARLRAGAGALAGLPRAATLNCPAWLLDRFDDAFGAGCAGELAALNAPAPVDLRTNLLRGSREDAQAVLRDEGYPVVPTPLSPLGLRSGDWLPLASARAFRDGLVEVQDEGSQLLALAVDARPGERVVDLCAGAGGKTLALAAAMGNRGELFACDVSPARLRRMAPRLRRAGVAIARSVPLPHGAPTPDIGPVDRVLIDAPCSGTGTWRRRPEARWRLTPQDLAAHVLAQAELLRSGAALVAPGGRLVYATCSLLPEENERQSAMFLQTHPAFRRLAAGRYLSADLLARAGLAADGDLALSPARSGTDGVYAAVFERRAAP